MLKGLNTVGAKQEIIDKKNVTLINIKKPMPNENRKYTVLSFCNAPKFLVIKNPTPNVVTKSKATSSLYSLKTTNPSTKVSSIVPLFLIIQYEYTRKIS